MGQKKSGTVVRIVPDRKFGFIRPDVNMGGEDHFFHRDDYNGVWEDMTKGDKVSYITVESPKGARAADVTPIVE